MTSSPLSRNYLASSRERQRPLQFLWIEVGYSYRHTLGADFTKAWTPESKGHEAALESVHQTIHFQVSRC